MVIDSKHCSVCCCRDNKKCPSVALMFPIGDNATYHRVSSLCRLSPSFSVAFFFFFCFLYLLMNCILALRSEKCILCKMGGCEQETDTCSSKTCHGHEVDIMHFSIGNAIPGRLYGGNPVDNSVGNGGDR